MRVSEIRDDNEGAEKHGMQSQRRDMRGYCKEGCGACCEFVVLNINPSYLEKDVRHWLELHGITLRESAGQVWANIPLPCSALKSDKGCGLFGTPERPLLCSAWPFNQQEIEEVNKTGASCTFYFTEGA